MRSKIFCHLLLALGAIVGARMPAAAGVTPIFLDAFESGDLCAWQGDCLPPPDISGSWVGILSYPGAVERSIVVQLHQRTDGRLLGYLPGTSESWVVRTGSYSAGILDLELILGRPAGDRIVTLSGPVTGERATLSLTGDLPTQTVELVRWAGEIVERRFVFADSTDGFSAPHFINLGIALDVDGQLVTGSWSGSEQKPPWGRDGGVTSFSANDGEVTVGLDLDGGCSDGSFLDAAFDPSLGVYLGTFDVIDCDGSQGGTLLGGFVDGTTSGDVDDVLSTLAAVADQLEAEIVFMAPHPSFTDTYLHDGKDLSGLFANLASEMAAWNDIDFDVFDVSRIATVEEPGQPPILSRPKGVDFHQVRSGVPSGGGTREVYFDTREDFLAPVTHNQLGVFVEYSGVWKIGGNQQPAFDLPWISAAMQPGDRRLEVSTPSDAIHVAIGGYGGHFSPVGNHSFGDRKANFAGFLPADDVELDELVGDGIGDDDGTCSPAELEAGGCAYWAELDGSLVRQRTPWYRAPQDGVISGIKLKSGAPPQGYFDGVPHWEVAMALDSGIKMELGHVGRIGDDVALAVLAETGCDPRSWESCDGVGDGSDILLGASPIPISAGDPVAQPEVFADEVSGFAGYRVGGGGYPEYPWVQMEFNVSAVVGGRYVNACVFALMDSNRASAYIPVMEADMADPYSQRYRTRFDLPGWAWKAEAALCNSQWQGETDFSSLFTSLGGWYEKGDAGIVSDELVAFAPIATETGLYDASLYEPGTDTLIRRQRAYYAPFSWEMPDLSVIDIWEPTGELLEKTSTSLLVLWRDIGWVGGDVYQAAAYRLDENGLTIEWGPFEETSIAALAAAPTLGAAEPCNENTVICYNHDEQPGY